jgi:carboxyl-terminal processing protease
MTRWMKSLSLLLILCLTFAGGYAAGTQSNRPAQAQEDDLNELFSPVFETYDVLNNRYIDPLEQEILIEGAINGMVNSIGDPNTVYLNADSYGRWAESLSGGFEGIGATVEKDDTTGGMRIIGPLPDSPAEEAGLQAGDIIMEVGGDDITALALEEIIALVRGPAGTIVRLGILREGETELQEYTIVRARIDLPDVEFRLLENNVGYVRLYQFTDTTPMNLQNALIELDAENLNGLVLDLRNNPGGFLDSALQVLSQFVTEGPILIEELPGGEEQIFEATGNPLAPTVPLAILVDAGSASASELVSGSLRDLNRAVVVGTTTFGKNTVQTSIPISTGGAVNVTIARWVTPLGNSSAPDGVQPDVVVEFDPESDPEFDNQLAAAVRALKGMERQQLSPVERTQALF